eukprot:7371006-Pyramimonas_sp.AAC.1
MSTGFPPVFHRCSTSLLRPQGVVLRGWEGARGGLNGLQALARLCQARNLLTPALLVVAPLARRLARLFMLITLALVVPLYFVEAQQNLSLILDARDALREAHHQRQATRELLLTDLFFQLCE